MMDITKIPIQKLLKDKKESITDIAICKQAISVGVTRYSGGSVRERLESNEFFVIKIDRELARRSRLD